MGKDLSDHRGFFDGSDDFQFTPTMRTAFDVDIEHPFKQTSPANAGCRWWARCFIVLISPIIGIDRFVWDDFGTVFGVGVRQDRSDLMSLRSLPNDRTGRPGWASF